MKYKLGQGLGDVLSQGSLTEEEGSVQLTSFVWTSLDQFLFILKLWINFLQSKIP